MNGDDPILNGVGSAPQTVEIARKIEQSRTRPDRGRMHVARMAAKNLYPPVIAQFIVDEIGVYEDFGYLYDHTRINRLIDYLITENRKKEEADGVTPPKPRIMRPGVITVNKVV